MNLVPKPPKAEPRARQRNSTLPVASNPIKSSGKIKAKKRSAKETVRIYGPEAFRDWLHEQPCAVCGWRGAPEYMQQAHAKTGGMARKDDWTRTLPLCGPRLRRTRVTDLGNLVSVDMEMYEGCHEASRARQSFEAKYGVSLLDLAAKTQAAWQWECARRAALGETK